MALLGRSAQGVYVDKKFRNETLSTLRSEAKDATGVAAKDCHRLGNGCMYTAEDVVQLREERERG